MNSVIKALFSVSCFLLLAATAFSGELVLVKNGQPKARIVIDADAASTARLAASELQLYIEKATGAKLAIVSGPIADGMIEIVVGPGKNAEKLGVTTEGLARDAFRIKTVGSRVVVLGRDDPTINWDTGLSRGMPYAEHATLFGIYDFLERFLGIRWYLPIDIGEVVPKRATLAIPEVDILEAPNKIGRFIHISYGADDRDDPKPLGGGFRPGFQGKEAREYCRRRNLHALRMRYQTTTTTGNHTMPLLISSERCAKTHPEYFALFKNGKRGFKVGGFGLCYHCFSNPGTTQEIIRLARAFFQGKSAQEAGLPSWNGIGRETDKGKAFHILQDDGHRPCQCKGCAAFRQKTGLNDKEAESELMWSFIIKVANAVKPEFPNCFISIAAYGPLRSPPLQQKLPGNILVSGLAVMGPYDEFIPGARKKDEARVKKWVDTVGGRNIAGFYEYPLKGGWEHGSYKSHKSICGSVPRSSAAHYKRMADIGQGTYLYLMSHRFAYDHLNMYVFYKYHWNPRRDIDQLLDEYYTLFYGPAAAPMKKFWEEVEQQFRKVLTKVVDTPLGPVAATQDEQDLWEDIYGPQTIKRWSDYFARAKELAEQEQDPVFAKRVAYMKRNVLDTIAEGGAEYRSILSRASQTRLQVRRAEEPIQIDGNLSDPAWRKASTERLIVLNTLEKPARETVLKLLWDDKNLYVALDCAENEMGKVDASEIVNDQTRVWRNNGVEIFLDPDNKGRTHFQWLSNSKGTWADCHVYAKNMNNFSWNSGFACKVVEKKDGYTVEMAIPFACFPGGKPRPGDTWGANFIRKRKLQGIGMNQAEYNTWSPLVNQFSGFHRGIEYGKLDFVDKQGDVKLMNK